MMIPSPENLAKLKKEKLEASKKAKVHRKISNTFIESAIHNSTVGALKTIYYLASVVETIEDLDRMDGEKLLTIGIDTRNMLQYTNISLPELKRNVKAMQQTSITFIDEEENTEIGVSLLPYYKFIYGKHRIEVKIFVKIARLIIDVKRNYSMIDTHALMKFRSKHTLRLLPVLARISQYSENVAKRKTFELHELNALFGTNYKRLTDLDKFVLRRVKEELDAHGKLSFVYEANFDHFDAGRPKAVSITIDVIENQPRLF